MILKYLNKNNYDEWKNYYWDYQYILAKDYYIPLLKKWNYHISNKKILDIGCGNGGFTAAFGKDATIVGIDIKLFPWKTIPNVTYKSYDIFSNPKKLDTNFDLIIMRDVIEHIPLENKLNFIKTALSYGNKNAFLLITFPPFYSPFGLHQQVLLKTFIKYLPFLSSIPSKILIPILKILNENKKSINDIVEMYDCKMTIAKFESTINKLNLNIIKSRFFYSRPSHEIRYGIKTRRLDHNPMEILKEFYILGTVYLLK